MCGLFARYSANTLTHLNAEAPRRVPFPVIERPGYPAEALPGLNSCSTLLQPRGTPEMAWDENRLRSPNGTLFFVARHFSAGNWRHDDVAAPSLVENANLPGSGYGLRSRARAETPGNIHEMVPNGVDGQKHCIGDVLIAEPH